MNQEQYAKNYEEFMSLFDGKFKFLNNDLVKHEHLISIGNFKKKYVWANLMGLNSMEWGKMIKEDYEKWQQSN